MPSTSFNARPTIRVVFTDVDLPGTINELTLARYCPPSDWPPTILCVGSGMRCYGCAAV